MPLNIYDQSAINPNNLHESICSWFLGPQGENFDLFMSLLARIVSNHVQGRRLYHSEDGQFITSSLKETDGFANGSKKLEEDLGYLSGLLNRYCVPFYSTRYMGHMCWETSMPAILGSLVTILSNPNNVAFEASPITTTLEINVGKQFCDMLGYNMDSSEGTVAWGHICCDGSVANLESVWVARNLKFYPLSLRESMKSGCPLEFIESSFEISRCQDVDKLILFKDLTDWELLNLRPEVILDIPDRLFKQYGITPQFLEDALKPYLIQACSKESLQSLYCNGKVPQYLVPSTGHYSWPKAAALTGIGFENMLEISVDNNARISIKKLQGKLDDCLRNKQAVYTVVAVIGTTEEGAVDPLNEILKLRCEYQAKGLSFLVHADAAWGGYFASMLRDTFNNYIDDAKDPRVAKPEDEMQGNRDYVPTVTLRDSTVRQFEALKDADSITIDPHKSGYVPYPAGGLCYKDGRMRYLVTWTAPYIVQGDNGESIGIYGVEGSKPGGPAVATYLQHLVIEPTKYCHGGLLGEVSFNCKRISAHWASMSNKDTEFVVVPFNPLRDESSEEAIEAEKRFIRERILGRPNDELVKDQEAMNELCALGSDLNINAFACNFRVNGKLNTDVEEANKLNKRLYERFSITASKVPANSVPLFLSSTTFAKAEYGDCVKNFARRLGLDTHGPDLFVLRNVVMSPFTVAGNFVQSLANIFEEALRDEVKHIIEENTVTDHHHAFVLQGTSNPVHLVYRPLFYNVNGRFQVILSAHLDAQSLAMYQVSKKQNATVPYVLQTLEETKVSEILTKKSFKATLSGPNFPEGHIVTLDNIRVIKNRPLDTKYLDPGYPITCMPFYLYGKSTSMHADHMLLHPPNAQISAESVKLVWLEGPKEESKLDDLFQRGVIALFDLREITMQPFRRDINDPQRLFKTGTSFMATIYGDRFEAEAHGPGLADVKEEHKIGRASITFANSAFTDIEVLNVDNFTTLVNPDQEGDKPKQGEHPLTTRRKRRQPFTNHNDSRPESTHKQGRPRGYHKNDLPAHLVDAVPHSLNSPVSGPLGDLRSIRHGGQKIGKAGIVDKAEWKGIIGRAMKN